MAIIAENNLLLKVLQSHHPMKTFYIAAAIWAIDEELLTSKHLTKLMENFVLMELGSEKIDYLVSKDVFGSTLIFALRNLFSTEQAKEILEVILSIEKESIKNQNSGGSAD